jgi:hypothetical protein
VFQFIIAGQKRVLAPDEPSIHRKDGRFIAG